VERFNRTVLDEFFRETFREKFYASVEELQADLDKWLEPHRGYRNMGRRPIETIPLPRISLLLPTQSRIPRADKSP
jgi:hypothetical protein